MDRQTRLLNAHIELTVAIRASETWEKSYTDSPTTFKQLLRAEASLQAHVNQYLVGLRDRIPRMIRWHEAGLNPVTASAIPPASDETWATEAALLANLLMDDIIELLLAGANAGEDIYQRTAGFTTLHEAILEAARTQTADKVSLINKGTRTLIQKAIKESIARGEDISFTMQRVQQYVSNPVRAEMIAQTESVNAYQAGLDLFGDETGVKSWTWDALLGACKNCAPLDGVRKKVGGLFTLANGKEVSRPTAHTRCRCGRVAHYDE